MRHAMRRPGTSLVVLLVGMLLGAAIVVPLLTPNTASALTTYTRSVSCAGGSFFPADSFTTYDMSGVLRIRPTADGQGVFRCDPGLPHGAVVTQVRFTLFDGAVTGYVGPCALKRHSLQVAASIPEQLMASVTNTIGVPGTVRPMDSSIDFATIDNGKYAYWLECHLNYASPLIGIVGADVTFTITAAKG